MCGIVAAIVNSNNGFTQPLINAFKDMLHVNALRGMDATGIYYVNNTGDVQVHKDSMDSPDFLKTEEWRKSSAELYKSGVAVVGHCRAATRGEKKEENAHPFIVDNKIVLVHNGTMVGQHKHLADVEVDSHAIAHVLAAEDDTEAALTKINAAYALIWYNTQTGFLHAIRNDERPLYVAETEGQDMLIASEPSFIYMAAARNNIKLDKFGAVLLGKHRMLSVNLKNLKEAYDYRDLNCSYKYTYVKAQEVPFQEASQQTTEGTTGVLGTTIKIVDFTNRRRKFNWKSHGFVSITMAARIMDLGDWAPNPGKNQTLDSIIKRNETVLFEPEDYCVVDSTDANCQDWYCFGHIVSTDPEKDGLLVGYEIVAPNEEAVINHMKEDFYEGVVEYPLSMKRPNSTSVTGVIKLAYAKPVSLDVVFSNGIIVEEPIKQITH